VSRVLRRAADAGISWPLEREISDEALGRILFGERSTQSTRKQPDYEHIHKELAKSGVTLSLLWNEYCEVCRQEGSIPMMHTQFCAHYHEFAAKMKATLHIGHKPGERMEVDWAGTTTSIQDDMTGKPLNVYVFVAVLPYSGYTYAEGFLSRNQESWTAAHVNAFGYFGGVTKIIVPDNLKTGVTGRLDWYTPLINKTYHEMAEHYGVSVIPARVRKPKDKPSVESAVNVTSTWIMAALRNRQFFSVGELNGAIRKKLAELNDKPFQKRSGCRRSAFEEEKAFLLSLNSRPFELASWRIATVQLNYHIAVEKMNYSVPFEYIKRKVDIRMTKDTVEVFYGGNRIASHVRLYGFPGQYRTVTEHMPENHQQYNKWNAERFVSWASAIGPNTEAAVKSLLASRTVEQQSYKSCIGLLKLADKYSVSRLEASCRKALSYTASPSLKIVQTILKTGSDKITDTDGTSENTVEQSEFGLTRGAGYYVRGNRQC
jgi:transposase